MLTKTSELDTLIATFNEKREKGVDMLIAQIEEIEPAFEPLSVKLLDIVYKSNLEYTNDDFHFFCDMMWEDFMTEVKTISQENLQYSFEKESVEIEVDGSFVHINGRVNFFEELWYLRKYGELKLPYASAEILENSRYLEINLRNESEGDIDKSIEFLKESIKELESDLVDTQKYFSGYIKPIKEVYQYYDYFMNNQIEIFKKWLEEY